MADRAGLGFVGFIFGSVTGAVMLIAATVGGGGRTGSGSHFVSYKYIM